MQKKWFERFQAAMANAAQAALTPLMEEDNKEVGESLWNHLFDLDGPRGVKRVLDAQQVFFSRAFRGYIEITKSLETLEDISFYVGRFPFQKTRITRERYLQFHVEAYFSEVYILRERIKDFITLVERQYKRDPSVTDVGKCCTELQKMLAKTLDGIVGVRSGHVHESRFYDDGIERLSTIALLTRGSDQKLASFMEQHYRSEHRKVKKLWCDRIRGNNKALTEFLSGVFENLFKIMFTEAGQLRYPHGARVKSPPRQK